MSMAIAGIDAGATLCKLALISSGLQTAVFPSTRLEAILAQLEAWEPGRIAVTGGGAPRVARRIQGPDAQQLPEFEAWARGAPLLARWQGIALPPSYLLVSLGTGTSALLVEGDRVERAGGSALGGGTLLGLGYLLTDAGSFEELAELAARGDRRKVDLLVRDIYRDQEPPLPGDLTAASFGKLASRRLEDLACALVGLVGENIGLICGGLTRGTGAEAVVYGGSTLARNPVLQQILQLVTPVCGRPCHILEQGAFCGAVGAAALAGS